MKLTDFNVFSVRYEILRNNAVFAEIYPVDDNVTVTNSASSVLKKTIQGTFYEYDKKINFYKDRLRVSIKINEIEYPIGIFIITTESKKYTDGIKTVDLEGYSILYLAQQHKIENPLYISAGTNYISEIIRLLNLCGIENVEAEATSYTFATSRSDWDIGTPIINIVNQLLNEISYDSAWVNSQGAVKLTKVKEMSIENITHVYSADEYSALEDNYTITSDRFDKSNVFIVTCENPELDSLLSAKSENDNDNIPYSIVNMGRILHYEQVDNIPSQTALQNYADRLKMQSYMTEEISQFNTAIMPTHETFDIIAIENGDMSGIYMEVEWSIRLAAGESMSHSVRRITIYD